ncbi:hypothetical protein [Streptomyces sp. NPDC002547]
MNSSATDAGMAPEAPPVPVAAAPAAPDTTAPADSAAAAAPPPVAASRPARARPTGDHEFEL